MKWSADDGSRYFLSFFLSLLKSSPYFHHLPSSSSLFGPVQAGHMCAVHQRQDVFISSKLKDSGSFQREDTDCQLCYGEDKKRGWGPPAIYCRLITRKSAYTLGHTHIRIHTSLNSSWWHPPQIYLPNYYTRGRQYFFNQSSNAHMTDSIRASTIRLIMRNESRRRVGSFKTLASCIKTFGWYILGNVSKENINNNGVTLYFKSCQFYSPEPRSNFWLAALQLVVFSFS